ncbi:MAG TPA: hypothetical protein VE046_03860 [Steroidobacteraceae bacterium]|nr:hypothetical protein [Steroidobacteraceae bacterium]
MSSTRNRFLVAAAIFCCSHAHGALPDEIQVYTDDVSAPGERGIELHVNTTPSGRSRPDYAGEVTPYHGLRITPELSWGLVPDVDWGLYLPFVRSGDGTDYFAGPRFRLKWMPLRGKPGYFAGVNVELSFVERRFEEARRTAEIRPIVGYRDADWLLSFNPIVGTDLAGPQKGVLTFAPAFKIARSAGGGYALGAEYYTELGRLSHFAPSSEQSHILYFVLDTQKLNFGVGRGLNGATDRWTVKAIYSF